MNITTKDHQVDKELLMHPSVPTETAFILPMPNKPIALNQGMYKTCVPYSVAMAAMLAVYAKTNKWIVLSPESMRGAFPADDGGADIWYYAELLAQWGIITRSKFPHKGDNPQMADKLSQLIQNEPWTEEFATEVKCKAWSKLRNFDEIKRAVYKGNPVVCSISMNNNLGKNNGGVEPVFVSNATGRHAICVCGWKRIGDKEYLIAVNSYGAKNGDNGLLYIPRGRTMHDMIALDIQTEWKPKCRCIEFQVGSSVYYADGVKKEFEADPYIKNGRTFFPVRFVAENLGAEVDWDAQTSTAFIYSEEVDMCISDKTRKIKLCGKEVDMDVAPEIVNGRMMCPIRHIAEALNCVVEWDATKSKISIKTEERKYV